MPHADRARSHPLDGVLDRGGLEERREGQRIECGISETETKPGSVDRQDGPVAGRRDRIGASVAAMVTLVSVTGAVASTIMHGVLRRFDVVATRRCIIQVGRAHSPGHQERQSTDDRDEARHRRACCRFSARSARTRRERRAVREPLRRTESPPRLRSRATHALVSAHRADSEEYLGQPNHAGAALGAAAEAGSLRYPTVQ